MEDSELLSRWVAHADEAAFRTLVERYAGLVHGVAMRRAGNQHTLVEEIGQNVFAMLARKAGALSGHSSLAAWLHRAVVLEAAHLLRREAAHQRKLAVFSQQMMPMSMPPDSPHSGWHQDLDQALSRLAEPDRNLLLRRFFQGLSFREIAESAGGTEPAVRKRLERALERLTRQLNRQGITVPTVAAVAALEASFSHAAPPGFAAGVGGKALAAAPGFTSSQLFWNTIQLMTYGKIFPLTAACLLLLLAFSGSYALARYQARQEGSAMESVRDSSGSARKPASPGTDGRVAAKGSPGDSPDRARIRSGMLRIGRGIMVNFKERNISMGLDNPTRPGAADGIRAMAEFRDEDLDQAWLLLPDFRGQPDQYEGIAAFLAGIKAFRDPPREVLTALLDKEYRVKGRPPLFAVEQAVQGWFSEEPAAAWAWMTEAVAKGDFPFEERRPVGSDMMGEWLGKDPAAALAALAPLPAEWDRFAQQALSRALAVTDTREALWNRLREADDRTALLMAAAQPERSDWTRDTLLPWLLTRSWENGVTSDSVLQRWMWRDGALDEDRLGMLCESAGGLPTPEANDAVLRSVREALEGSSPESRGKLLEHLVKDPERRERLIKLL